MRGIEVARARCGWITQIERREYLARLRDERRQLLTLIDETIGVNS